MDRMVADGRRVAIKEKSWVEREGGRREVRA